MKRSTTKRTLLLSLLSVLMCVSMLIGTTFAWFTDSVSSGVNTLTAGNLDVELYNSLTTEDGKQVTASTPLFEEVKLWEPNAMAYENLTVANEGSLALKYRLAVNFTDATKTPDGKTLADILQVAVVPGGFSGDRAAAEGYTYATLADFEKYGNLYPNGATLGNTTETWGIIIWWKPVTNDDDFNMNNENLGVELSIKLGISLDATQVSSEYDSFGNGYDNNTPYPGTAYVPVTGGSASAPSDLQGAFDSAAADNGGEAPESILLNVSGATEWETGSGHGTTPFPSKDVTIVGSGAASSTLVATGAGVGPIRAGEGGKLVVKDITVKDETVSYAEDSWEFTYLELGNGPDDELYFENVTFLGGVMIAGKATFINCTFITEEDSVYGAWVDAGSATFTDCTFKGTRGLKMHEDYGTEITSVTVDNCLFDGMTKKPGIAIGDLNADTTVTVTDSTFNNCQAGDAATDPAKGKPYAYETDTPTGSFTFVYDRNNIQKTTEVEVNGASDLTSALTGAGAAGAGSTVVKLPANAELDMSGSSWTPVKVNGYNGADVVTIDGNGATITGLTAPLFAGGFAGGSGIVIRNLTIADSNIVSTNSVGAGAFIESIDSMDTIVLENCHFINSTLTSEHSDARTGGLIGWNSGYNNTNDGAVKTYVTIMNCSVKNCTITGKSSVGGIIGHAGANPWTYNTITDCVVSGNTLISTKADDWRVGEIVGTANVGEVTITSVACSGNTVKQDNATNAGPADTRYGRIALGTTGKLIIEGIEIK